MNKIKSYLLENWVDFQDEGNSLFNAVTGEQIYTVSTQKPDFKELLQYSRDVGTVNLKKTTFHQRARMLKELALYLGKFKAEFYQISTFTGATKTDSWIDIEGGFGNLFIYSGKGRRELPDSNLFIDGDAEQLSKGGSFIGQHVFVPMDGCAVHINAFNFPVWGMLEKIAVNLLAGVACVVKPAQATSYLTEAVAKRIVESKILPVGAFQLICGSASGITDYVTSDDIVTFTGSAQTGAILKKSENIIKNNVRLNIEADSLNCSILGEDAGPDTEEFKLFVKEVVKEMTIKTGQKCTAIRRMIVPEKWVEVVEQALIKRLDRVNIGNPVNEIVNMGSLASLEQKEEVARKIKELKQECSLVYEKKLNLIDASEDKGAFVPCTILRNEKPFKNNKAHITEAFGPVSTIFPYKDTDEAIKLAKMGGGSLVGSVVAYNNSFIKDVVTQIGSRHGRILVLNRECAKESTGHGSPLPHLVHGGPGRAGGGEEMGGIRGVKHYMQRVAIQGSPTAITAITDVYQPKAAQKITDLHPFKYHYEDLVIGQTLITHNRTVTEADIVNFANLSGDNFYAHMDITSLEGTIFDRRVAHGYFVISAAAGLFVDPKKGPVLANYGIDFCRFLAPVYVNDTIGVRLTCKEKINKDTKGTDQPSGIVKWHVEVLNQHQDIVAVATILTLVAKKGADFMKFNLATINKAISQLTIASKPLWGKLSAQQMIEHLIHSLSCSIGKTKVEVFTPKDKLEEMRKFLFNNVAMAKNHKLPIHEKGMPSLVFKTLDQAKEQLKSLVKDFFDYYQENKESTHNNYAFGALNYSQWKRLHVKHFTHHFKQFGLL